MTRQAHTYWLRFLDAKHWRRWETNESNPCGVATEVAREFRCQLPIRIEVRKDNDGLVTAVNVLGIGSFGVTNHGTVEEIHA